MEKKSNGALVGSIIVIVILLIGGVYFYNMTLTQKEEPKQTDVKVQDSGLNGIESDLNSTDINSIDQNI